MRKRKKKEPNNRLWLRRDMLHYLGISFRLYASDEDGRRVYNTSMWQGYTGDHVYKLGEAILGYKPKAALADKNVKEWQGERLKDYWKAAIKKATYVQLVELDRAILPF